MNISNWQVGGKEVWIDEQDYINRRYLNMIQSDGLSAAKKEYPFVAEGFETASKGYKTVNHSIAVNRLRLGTALSAEETEWYKKKYGNTELKDDGGNDFPSIFRSPYQPDSERQCALKSPHPLFFGYDD